MSFKAQPGRIRSCVSTHTALMMDGRRGSGREDIDDQSATKSARIPQSIVRLPTKS
jgi:hypothetical protein